MIVVDFPVYPPRGGGQSRIFHLYRALARRVDVTLITLCDDAQAAGELQLAPGFREIRVAKSPVHLEATQALHRKLAALVGDIATLLHYELTPAYRERLQALYGCGRSQATLVPNGVDARAVRFVTRAERRSNQCRLGLDRRLSMLFVGSWHQPNTKALGHLKRIAHACPEADFLIVGSVSGHAALESHATNLHPLGILDDAELTVVTEAVDLTVNPITTGSGTNLKMLRYAAAGISILTTASGNWGLAFRPEEHLWQAPVDEFPATIRRLREGLESKHEDEPIEAMVRQARELVESRYDWRTIVDGIELPADLQ